MSTIINQIVELKNTSLFNSLVKIAKISIPIVVGVILYNKYKRYKRRQAYPKDVVILHQFSRGLRAPSPSPFALKLETWLRMANIKYQNEFGFTFGPKGKVPWITLNGQDVADSHFCIEYLSKIFDKDLSAHLSKNEKSIARAFLKMTEESLSRIMAIQRFVLEPNPKSSGLPKILLFINGFAILKKAKAHGYGLHSKEELYSIATADLDSINEFIGNKRFLFGDNVCDEDASLFGVLCQLYYHERGYPYQHIINKCPNIIRFIENVKQTYWPDWNENVREH